MVIIGGFKCGWNFFVLEEGRDFLVVEGKKKVGEGGRLETGKVVGFKMWFFFVVVFFLIKFLLKFYLNDGMF